MEHHDFEIGLATALLAAKGDRLDALRMLADALARAGRHAEALDADRRILKIDPKNPTAHYNLACSYSNLDQLDKAFQSLEKAFECGYRDYKHLLRDRDLEKVRKDPRFRTFLDKRWGKRQARK
ncbi:MAG: tetratricopeptide repeat protein [Planctomycetes bacterium]|nr:tetratricopeptide repeat protein [Planctomycetota bacterium]